MKLSLLIIFLLNFSLMATEFVPSNLLSISPKFSKTLLIAEKTKLRIHVYKVSHTKAERIKSFKMAYGKSPGNKVQEGDKKTPEGIYFIRKFIDSKTLINRYGDYGKIYGAGAFPLDYPNIIDKLSGKTGNGIWLHSTNDESRISKGLDSRGCLVVGDADLKEISKYIDIYSGTPIVVVQDLNFIDKESQIILNQKLRDTVDNWALGWKLKNLKNYISSYHKDFKSKGRSLGWFREYKRNVFKKTTDIDLQLSNYSALQYKNYAVVTINQYYSSNLVQDRGLKTLFFSKNSKNEWKIIHENWARNKRIETISRTKEGYLAYF